MELRRTALYDSHASLGARMVPFAGWEMPVQYPEGIIAEHSHTRKLASVFDICHMGEFRVKGAGAAEALDGIFARPVLDQKPGSCRYSFLLTDQGTVIDDLIVYRIGAEEFFIVVNASTKDGDAERIRSLLPQGVSFADESDETAKIDLQGPASAGVLEQLGLDRKALPPYYGWIKTEIGGIPVLLSRTGYTGELGFEIYFNARHAAKIWELLLAQKDVKPAGLGARDTLRLEMAYPLYGHELNLSTTPVEAGFGKMLKLESGRNFPGAVALRNSRPKKNLAGVVLDGRRAAREGTEILHSGKPAGKVTSGAFGPSIGAAVALVYLDAGIPTAPGTELTLKTDRAELKGRVAELPFYRNATTRASI